MTTTLRCKSLKSYFPNSRRVDGVGVDAAQSRYVQLMNNQNYKHYVKTDS